MVNEHGDCIECPENSEWKDGHCICHDRDDEDKKENNKYALFTAPSKHECVDCPEGDTSKHGVCSSEDCPKGLTKNDDGKCVCEDEKESKKSGENKCHCEGYKDKNGCHECPPHSKWDPVTEQCKCDNEDDKKPLKYWHSDKNECLCHGREDDDGNCNSCPDRSHNDEFDHSKKCKCTEENEHWDEKEKKCVCDGHIGKGGKCLPNTCPEDSKNNGLEGCLCQKKSRKWNSDDDECECNGYEDDKKECHDCDDFKHATWIHGTNICACVDGHSW